MAQAPETTDYNAMADEVFRRMVRDWIEANYPQAIRNPPQRLGWKEVKDWYLCLSAKGWLAPSWPVEHGGMGLDSGKQLIMIEEMERHGCARMPDHGIIIVGPLLIRYGTEEQKDYFLPRILSGDHVWCQGYSEPNAGSDLASLRTEAVLDGDHWVVNGQKIWTTMALEANWIYLLVRTDKDCKPQKGISFLLAPMDLAGIEPRAITNLEMHHGEFCEVFFSDVRVPKANLLGEINQGWTMAKAQLGFERIFLGSPKQSTNALERLAEMARRQGLWDDPVFLEKFARLSIELDSHKALFETFADRLRQGRDLGPDVSMLKIYQSELYQRISSYLLEISGVDSGLFGRAADNRGDLNPAGNFIQSLPTTIYGGTNEIQRNILAKNVLGLPG